MFHRCAGVSSILFVSLSRATRAHVQMLRHAALHLLVERVDTMRRTSFSAEAKIWQFCQPLEDLREVGGTAGRSESREPPPPGEEEGAEADPGGRRRALIIIIMMIMIMIMTMIIMAIIMIIIIIIMITMIIIMIMIRMILILHILIMTIMIIMMIMIIISPPPPLNRPPRRGGLSRNFQSRRSAERGRRVDRLAFAAWARGQFAHVQVRDFQSGSNLISMACLDFNVIFEAQSPRSLALLQGDVMSPLMAFKRKHASCEMVVRLFAKIYRGIWGFGPNRCLCLG